MFTIESVSWIIEANDNFLLAWFPPINGFLKICTRLASSSFETEVLESKSFLGKFCNLKVTGDYVSFLNYENLLVSEITFLPNALSPTLKSPEELAFHSMLMSRVNEHNDEVYFTNVPVFIGNYLHSKQCFVGYNNLFGRILVQRFGQSLCDVKQFNTYLCDVGRCSNSSATDLFQWEVVTVHNVSKHMPNIRITKAKFHKALSNKNDNFLFVCSENDNENVLKYIHINSFDIRECVSSDLEPSVELKVIVGENSFNLNSELFPTITCFATVFDDEELNIKWLPIHQMNPYSVTDECCELVRRIVSVIGSDQISLKFPPETVALFQKWCLMENR